MAEVSTNPIVTDKLEETEPIDYALMKELPPWIDRASLNANRKILPPTVPLPPVSFVQPRMINLQPRNGGRTIFSPTNGVMNHVTANSIMNHSSILPTAVGPAIYAAPPRPTQTKIRPYPVPFAQLGPSYTNVFCLAGTSILLRNIGPNQYAKMGSFAPHLKEFVRPLNPEEESVLTEAKTNCGFQIV
jgi:hypothetical protein